MIDYKKILWSLAALPLLASCAADEPLSSGNTTIDPSDENGVYMAVDLSFASQPKGTRSFTNGDNSSNDGVEIGTAEENAVNSVLIVLAQPTTNKFIASSLVDNSKLSSMTSGADKIYRANAKFSKTAINSYYSTLTNLTTNPTVNVFIYCNPTSAMQSQITNNDAAATVKWYDKVYEINSDDQTNDDALWNAEKGFVMTNVSMATRTLPATMDDWNHYTSETKPFDLSGFNNPGQTDEVDNETNKGAINVHRMAARFDFRDGSQMLDVPGCNGVEGVPFTYNVILDTENQPIVQAEIVRMMMVNMGLSEYYLGRVSADGLNNNVELLGAEKPWYSNANGTVIPNSGNYVVSPNAAIKQSTIDNQFNGSFKFSDYFKYPFFTDNGVVSSQGAQWGTAHLVKDVAKKANDYSFWRYATENTIPGDEDNQVNSMSTGIVFKAKIKATEKLLSSSDANDIELYNALNNVGNKLGNPNTDPILYSYAGKLYATWNQVQEAALYAAGYDPSKTTQNLDRSTSLYMACFGDGGAGTITIGGKTFTDDLEEDIGSANYGWTSWNAKGKPSSGTFLNDFKSQVTGAGFTIYQSSDDEETGWGYYCYYYYWNRHNDNGKSGVMGPMEFAVVRNNVYKLAVTRLSTLGHPRVPENDPDSPKPNTPDEKSDLYITVSVKVMPWVVRVNHIEF